jgi:hypothetical protein
MSNESVDQARQLLGQPHFTVRPLRDELVERHGWPAASDAALATGRDAIFDSCQCLAGGAR